MDEVPFKCPSIDSHFHDFTGDFQRSHDFNKVFRRQSMLSIEFDNTKINYWRLRYLKTNFHFDFSILLHGFISMELRIGSMLMFRVHDV